MTPVQLTQRDLTLDIARGLAIIMIVLGHVLRGLVSAELVDSDEHWFVLTDQLLYSVHLGVFAFASGLFVARGVSRDGVGQYLRQRDVTFLWLFLLWTLIQGAVKLAAGSSVNSTSSIGDILNLSHPQGQLWFLPWLIVVTTLAAISGIWRSRLRIIIGVTLALVVSILGWGTDPGVAGVQGLGLWVFFAAGVALQAGPLVAVVSRANAGAAALASVIALGGLVALVATGAATSPTPSSGQSVTPLGVAAGLGATTLGICGVIAVARLMALARMSWFAVVGRRTLEIFLGSITFASGSRIVLARLGVDSVLTQVVLGTLIGVVGPMLLAVVADRVGARWLFAAPRALTGASQPARAVAGRRRATPMPSRQPAQTPTRRGRRRRSTR